MRSRFHFPDFFVILLHALLIRLSGLFLSLYVLNLFNSDFLKYEK